jgi:uncharacterized protein (DUF427 family)
MKTPGPDHPITIEPYPRRVRVDFSGHRIADSDDVLVLREAGYKPVYYFPRDAVAMDYLARTDRRTYCPYKGDASYYTLAMDGHIEENAVWTYETPYDFMSPIAGRLAFYPDKVTISEAEREHSAEEVSQEIREAVLHTDSGAGSSQREHWPTNVSQPLS